MRLVAFSALVAGAAGDLAVSESVGPLIVDTLASRELSSFGSGSGDGKAKAATTPQSFGGWSRSPGGFDGDFGSSPELPHRVAPRKDAPWNPAEALDRGHWQPREEAKREMAKKPQKSQWERHQKKEKLDSRQEELKHADSALAYMEERAVGKLQADIEEVDHLIVRRHLLTDRKAEAEADAAVLESHAVALKDAAKEMGRANKWPEAMQANTDVQELRTAAASLRGSAGELAEISKDIEQSTEDGKRMNLKVKEYSHERAALARQIHVLTVEGEHVQEKEETAQDLEAFEKAGYEGVTDEDDPYMKEAESALEHVSGWDSDKLDDNAVKAREAMTKGMAGDPAQAVKALRVLAR